VKRAGWDGMMQIREEVNFTKGRIIVRGKLVTRGKAKRADYRGRLLPEMLWFSYYYLGRG
jgi:type I site-specific restriction endonuclease